MSDSKVQILHKVPILNHLAVLLSSTSTCLSPASEAPPSTQLPWSDELTLVLCPYTQTTLISYLECCSSLLSMDLQIFLILCLSLPFITIPSCDPFSNCNCNDFSQTMWPTSHYLFAAWLSTFLHKASLHPRAHATLVFFTYEYVPYSLLPQGHGIYCSLFLDHSLPS